QQSKQDIEEEGTLNAIQTRLAILKKTQENGSSVSINEPPYSPPQAPAVPGNSIDASPMDYLPKTGLDPWDLDEIDEEEGTLMPGKPGLGAPKIGATVGRPDEISMWPTSPTFARQIEEQRLRELEQRKMEQRRKFEEQRRKKEEELRKKDEAEAGQKPTNPT